MMGAMRVFLAATASCLLALRSGAAQDKPEPAKADPATDVLFLQDRTELRGEILQYSASGRLKVKVSGSDKPVELGLEEVARLRFSSEESRPATPAGEQARLSGGGTLSGKLLSFDGEIAVLEGAAGPIRLRRGDLKAFLLGQPEAPLPTLRDEKKDILIREAEKKPEGNEKASRECVAEYGRLKSIGAKVLFQVTVPAEGDAKERTEDREFERATVKHLYLQREPGPTEFPPGLFGKVTLKNGDRWVAVLQAVTRDRVRLFSHMFGSVELDKSKVHSISFIQQAQLTAGNILITDQTGIHEFDAQRQEIWTYNAAGQGAAIARKLRNGNVLVADPTTNSVLEIRPQGRTGGEVVWRIEEVQNPWDVARLDNGNTLVTERYNSRVVEYDAKSREVVWQAIATYPMAAQRLENGNTLITTNNAVFEVTHDPQPKEQWRANLLRAGTIRPHRAVRLENGNTLITDQQKGQVVELDSNSVEVWKVSGLSHPAQAVRLEDGNTLILEQGANRVVEVDPANPRNRTEILKRGLSVPMGMTTY
jgi:DNA-binding beta-propeller fold protein YncE